MDELKPCPFCGGTKFWIENRNWSGMVPQYVVTCVNCFKRSKPRSTNNRARKEWNRMVENGKRKEM